MTAFPLSTKQDSAKYGFEQEDTGMRTEMEGGYVITRPRHTRAPRRTWRTGFSDLSNTDKQVFEDFVTSVGTYKAFDYYLPVVGTLVNVRLKEIPKYKYLGFGSNMRWAIDDIVLEEV